MVVGVRIISGKAGRVSIQVPASVSRPTTDFVRQALFSIMCERVEGSRVLDLFAGSGALGMEALSRGAMSCVFVDQHRQAASVIEKNLGKTKLTGGRVVTGAVDAFLRRDVGIYDIILADPPYWKFRGDADEIGKLGASGLLSPRLAEDGWFIAEVSSAYRPVELEGMRLMDRRAYGSSALLFFQRGSISV